MSTERDLDELFGSSAMGGESFLMQTEPSYRAKSPVPRAPSPVRRPRTPPAVQLSEPPMVPMQTIMPQRSTSASASMSTAGSLTSFAARFSPALKPTGIRMKSSPPQSSPSLRARALSGGSPSTAAAGMDTLLAGTASSRTLGGSGGSGSPTLGPTEHFDPMSRLRDADFGLARSGSGGADTPPLLDEDAAETDRGGQRSVTRRSRSLSSSRRQRIAEEEAAAAAVASGSSKGSSPEIKGTIGAGAGAGGGAAAGGVFAALGTRTHSPLSLFRSLGGGIGGAGGATSFVAAGLQEESARRHKLQAFLANEQIHVASLQAIVNAQKSLRTLLQFQPDVVPAATADKIFGNCTELLTACELLVHALQTALENGNGGSGASPHKNNGGSSHNNTIGGGACCINSAALAAVQTRLLRCAELHVEFAKQATVTVADAASQHSGFAKFVEVQNKSELKPLETLLKAPHEHAAAYMQLHGDIVAAASSSSSSSTAAPATPVTPLGRRSTA